VHLNTRDGFLPRIQSLLVSNKALALPLEFKGFTCELILEYSFV